MRPSFSHSLIASILLFLLTSCGGGGSGGIGGTGVTSGGTITGFGSIFVNGVKFDTSSSNINIDGNIGSEADLKLGMFVLVHGTLNADSTTGIANDISTNIELKGPVSGTPDVDLNNNTVTFTVFGHTVFASADSTVFDGSGFAFDSIAENDVLEIYGLIDSNAIINATRIELKGPLSTTTDVEVNGSLGQVQSNMSFELLTGGSTIVINHDGSTDYSSLATGTPLEVKGIYASANEVNADEIKQKSSLFNDTDGDVEIEGIITDYIDDTNFKVNGIQVDASGITIPLNLSLGFDVKIEVEGTFSNNILIASEIEARSGEIKIQSIVSDISNISNNKISLSYGSGESVEVSINNLSKLEDDLFDLEPFSISNIEPNNYLEIKALLDGDGNVIVTDLKRKSPESEASLKGPVDPSGIVPTPFQESITILGVSHFANSNTKLEINDVEISNLSPPLSRSEFFDMLNEGDTLEIEDGDDINTPDGIADEISLEN